MSKISIFKPEDFLGTCGARASLSRELCAQVANARLQSLIEAATTVYTYPGCTHWQPLKSEHDKLQARLMFIEKLPVKECVEHDPINVGGGSGLIAIRTNGGYVEQVIQSQYRCKHCNVPLKQKWEAVNE